MTSRPTSLQPFAEGIDVVAWGGEYEERATGEQAIAPGSTLIKHESTSKPPPNNKKDKPTNKDLLAMIKALEKRMKRAEKEILRLKRRLNHFAIYEDHLSEDTLLDTVDTWVALPGLERAITPKVKSVAHVTVVLRVSCAELSTAADSRFLARILVDGEEVTRAQLSLTDLDLRNAARLPDYGTFPVALQTTVYYAAHRDKTVSVEAGVFVGAQDWTVIVGEAGQETDSSMVFELMPGNEPPHSPATDEGESFVRILDHSYDTTNHRAYVLRIRGEWDEGTPGTGTPDRAYLEVTRYDSSALPLTDVMAGPILYSRPVENVSAFDAYYSWAFAVEGSSGKVGFCYGWDEEGTAGSNSRKFATVVASTLSGTLEYDAFEGPSWHATTKGDAVWCQGNLFMVEPTEDTDAQEGSIPFKSGKRCTKRSGSTGAVLADSGDIQPDTGHRVRWPISLSSNGTTALLWYAEVESAVLTTYGNASFDVGFGGDNPVTFSVDEPDECGSIRYRSGTADYLTHDTDGNDLHTYNGTSTQTAFEENVGDWDAHIEVNGDGDAVLFVRGAEPGRTTPWLQVFDGA